jgi:hypothetical protein
VEEAFEAFLAFVKAGKGFSKRAEPVCESVEARKLLVSNSLFVEAWIYFVTMQES